MSEKMKKNLTIGFIAIVLVLTVFYVIYLLNVNKKESPVTQDKSPSTSEEYSEQDILDSLTAPATQDPEAQKQESQQILDSLTAPQESEDGEIPSSMRETLDSLSAPVK